MSRPRISYAKRRLWRMYPLSRVGATYRPDILKAISDALHEDDTYRAQQIVLKHIRSELEGPRTVARQRGRRKVLQAVG